MKEKSPEEQFYKWLYLWALDRYLELKRARNSKERYIGVTDHAVVRYFERVLGQDIDKVREKLAQDVRLLNQLYADSIVNSDDMQAVVMNKKIITVLKPGMKTFLQAKADRTVPPALTEKQINQLKKLKESLA